MIPMYALQAMHSSLLSAAIPAKDMFHPIFLTGGGDAGSLANILSAATQLLTWFISSMGTILSFIVDNPVILMLFLILMVGSAVAMLFRIWHSA